MAWFSSGLPSRRADEVWDVGAAGRSVAVQMDRARAREVLCPERVSGQRQGRPWMPESCDCHGDVLAAEAGRIAGGQELAGE
jgi:hypothetical protein